MRRHYLFTIVFVFVIVLGVVWLLLPPPAVVDDTYSQQSINVHVQEVQYELHHAQEQAIGFVTKSKANYLFAYTSGVINVEKSVGDSVNKGDLIAMIDNRFVVPSQQTIISQVQDLTSKLNILDHKINDYELFDQKPFWRKVWHLEFYRSTDNIDQWYAAKELLKQRILQLEMELNRLNQMDHYHRIIAPSKGRLSEIFVSNGQLVQPGMSLFEMTPNDDLILQVFIPNMLSSPDQWDIFLKAEPNQPLQFYNVVQDDNGLLHWQYLLNKGYQADVTDLIPVLRRSHQKFYGVVIPLTALYPGDHIYQVKQNRLTKIKVDVLAKYRNPDDQPDQVIIRSHLLKDGEEILVDRIRNINESMTVNATPI